MMLHHCYAASASPKSIGSGCRGFLNWIPCGHWTPSALEYWTPFGHFNMGRLNCEAVQFSNIRQKRMSNIREANVQSRKAGLLLSGFFLTGNRFALALPGAGVGFGTLSAQRQSFPVTQTAVAGDVHQALDVHLNFRAQGTFYFEFGVDQVPDSSQFIIVPLHRFFVAVDAGFVEDALGSAAADAVDVSQRDFAALVFG